MAALICLFTGLISFRGCFLDCEVSALSAFLSVMNRNFSPKENLATAKRTLMELFLSSLICKMWDFVGDVGLATML